MKKIVFITLIASFGLTFINSCDKVEQPIKTVITIDTTLYTDGNWDTYPWPDFQPNTNNDRNILIEDFTGHKCIACPTAAYIAKGIEDAHPGRVFVVGIHAGPNGSNTLQEPQSDCGTASNPNDEFCHNFLTDEGTEYSIKLSGNSFFGTPQGMVSRTLKNNGFFQIKTDWEPSTNDLLAANNLTVNMQAASNYYPASNGLYLHVQSEFKQNLTGNFNITTYVVDNQVIAWQDSANVIIEHYHHHNVFLGCIDGEAWGQNLASDPVNGDIIQTDYAYVLPDNVTTDSIHFISYVYNVDTYEILQVIEHNP